MSRLNKNNLIRGINYLTRNGIRESYYKAVERLIRDDDEADYDSIMRNNQLNDKELSEERGHHFSSNCKISILIPVYETIPSLLTETLESVAKQTYGNWELCIADASKDDRRRETVRDFCEKWNLKVSDSYGNIYSKVNYKYLETNEGISENTNKALEMASGDYVGLLDHDDLLEANALYEFMVEVNKRELKAEKSSNMHQKILVCYTDEDKISMDNTRYFDHHIKPDFDPVLLCTNNYICHFLIVDTNLARSVGGFHGDYNGAQDHDFILRCTEGIDRKQIVHLPKVLYHWRSTQSSTAENPNAKLYAYKAGRRAVEAHLYRMGISASVTDTAHLGFYRVDYHSMEDEGNIFYTTPEKLFNMTDKEICNIDKDYIMILSDELKPLHSDYAKRLLNCMVLESVGAVTGKIINKGRIESAGYDILENGELSPRFSGLKRYFSGYLHRASIQQIVAAYSKDCVLIRRKAVINFAREIVLCKGYDIYYEPSEEFKRLV